MPVAVLGLLPKKPAYFLRIVTVVTMIRTRKNSPIGDRRFIAQAVRNHHLRRARRWRRRIRKPYKATTTPPTAVETFCRAGTLVSPWPTRSAPVTAPITALAPPRRRNPTAMVLKTAGSEAGGTAGGAAMAVGRPADSAAPHALAEVRRIYVFLSTVTAEHLGASFSRAQSPIGFLKTGCDLCRARASTTSRAPCL